jgi:hypothetical protein
MSVSVNVEKIGVRFPAGPNVGLSSLHYCVHTGSGAHPTSYPVGAVAYFGGKADGA